MTKQRALAVLILLTLLASLSMDVPAYQGKSKGKGKSEKSEGSGKKSGKSEDDSGSEKGLGKSDSDEDSAPPLFKGKLGLRGSSQSKDQATLGFNGVEPDGSLQEAMLKSKPSADDEKKADRVSALAVKPDALDAFIRRGKLNAEPPQKKDKRDKKDSK